MDLADYAVLAFSYDANDPDRATAVQQIRSIIATKTNRKVHQVSPDKPQLQYMLSYLANEQIGAKTIVVESTYIDKHYLEDYAEYYSRCFAGRSRKCSRLHFFEKEFNEEEFLALVNSGDDIARETLQSSYLGYCVIRPMPETYLGRVNFVPYDLLIAPCNTTAKLITKRNPVSLFGIPLTVETIGLREQDRVVSACATSAIWTLLSGYGALSAAQMPSLSTITKNACGSDSIANRVFPSSGLLPHQVTNSLQSFGLEPLQYQIQTGDESDPAGKAQLQRWVNAYVGANVPILIGGEVFRVEKEEEDADETVSKIGDHYVCVLGYNKEEKIDPKNEHTVVGEFDEYTLKEASSRISKLYVHDDRYGQYLTVEVSPVAFHPDDLSKLGFPIDIVRPPDRKRKEYLVPTHIIFGTDHKIRLTFLDILEVINALFRLIALTHDQISAIDDGTDVDELADAFAVSRNSDWDISLIKGVDLKTEIRRSHATFENWFTSFGGRLADLLTVNLPKHIWRCTAIDRSGQPQMDLLFDATEIKQGDIFLGYVAYSSAADEVWNELDSQIAEKVWDENCKLLGEGPIELLRSIQSRLQVTDINLDKLYGKVGVPRRPLKIGEVGEVGEITQQSELVVQHQYGDVTWEEGLLDRSTKYIWVIDQSGSLVVGKDLRRRIEGSDEYEFQGHPTLVDYAPARIAGEIFYDNHRATTDSEETEGWWINTKSGTYSLHIRGDKSEQESKLKNVIETKFRGFPQAHKDQQIMWTVVVE